MVIGTRVILLGIVSAVAVKKSFDAIELRNVPTAQVAGVPSEQMLDLGVVVKSSVILETVLDFLTKTNQIAPSAPLGTFQTTT